MKSKNAQLMKELIIMKFRLSLTILASSMLLVILSACGTTEYYRDRAVQKARKFLLQEDRTLNLEQREYVKFNKPVIMAAPIFTKLNSSSAVSGTLSHICIAWIAPGRKDAHVVFGVSDNHLRDWTPNRVIVKRYDQPARKYHVARQKALLYGVNNFLYLTNQQLNRIRFEIPETIITDYKFNKDNLKDKGFTEEQVKSLVQVTFIWSAGKYDKRLFVCGLGAKDLAKWKPVFGGETTTAELRKRFLGEISFGQFFKDEDRPDKVAIVKQVIEASQVPETKEKIKVPEAKTPELKKVKEKTKVPEVKVPEVKEVKEKTKVIKIKQ